MIFGDFLWWSMIKLKNKLIILSLVLFLLLSLFLYHFEYIFKSNFITFYNINDFQGKVTCAVTEKLFDNNKFSVIENGYTVENNNYTYCYFKSNKKEIGRASCRERV